MLCQWADNCSCDLLDCQGARYDRAMITRRIARIALVLGVATFAAAPVATASTAKLRVVKDLPLTLKGVSFKPAELVTVTVHVNDRKLTRTARSSAAGAFTVAFAGVRFDPCKSRLTAVAHGRRTGIVRLALPLRECPAP